MKCYQCHKEMGRNRYPMIYCRHPFCEKCGQQRQWRRGPTYHGHTEIYIEFDDIVRMVQHLKEFANYTFKSKEGA